MNKILLYGSCMGLNDECQENWIIQEWPIVLGRIWKSKRALDEKRQAQHLKYVICMIQVFWNQTFKPV